MRRDGISRNLRILARRIGMQDWAIDACNDLGLTVAIAALLLLEAAVIVCLVYFGASFVRTIFGQSP